MRRRLCETLRKLQGRALHCDGEYMGYQQEAKEGGELL